MSRRKYANPPVHEVVLDILFQEQLRESAMQDIPGLLAEEFGVANRHVTHEMRAEITPAGPGKVDATSTFSGWAFEQEKPVWVLRTLVNRITLHAARAGEWPDGPYVGWEAVFNRFLSAFKSLTDSYSSFAIQRIGLRYQNRIAHPIGTPLRQWFQMHLNAPPVLEGTFSFHLRQTWERVAEHRDVSATINLARIELPNEELRESSFGVLLDIDVFNLQAKHAPSFEDVPDWFLRAHEGENEIFEGCITDDLRQHFD